MFKTAKHVYIQNSTVFNKDAKKNYQLVTFTQPAGQAMKMTFYKYFQLNDGMGYRCGHMGFF
jgi:hypothetical protein